MSDSGTRVPEQSLVEMLANVPISFSRWCRSGWIGQENCICDRCLRARGLVGDDGKTDAREKEAERLAALLDRAHEVGRVFGKLQAGMQLPPEIMEELAALTRHGDEKSSDSSKIDDTLGHGHDPGDEHR